MFGVIEWMLKKIKLNKYVNFIKFFIQFESLGTIKTLWHSWSSKWKIEAMGDGECGLK